MKDLARHKLLLGLATSIVKKSNHSGIMLPRLYRDAIRNPDIISIQIYDQEIPVTTYLKPTLGECLSSINEDDYTVLKAYVHSIQHDSVDIDTPDNIAFSGGGGKGIGYSGLIKYLSEESIYTYSQQHIKDLLINDFGIMNIPNDSPIFINSKMKRDEFLKELSNLLGSDLNSAHALYILANQGAVKEKPIIETIRAVSGTSAGAITALPVALGMNYEDYSRLIINSQFNHFFVGSSRTISSITRILKPNLYRNSYVKKYSSLYVEKITERIGEILPEIASDYNPDEKRALVHSLLNNATSLGLDYLHQRVRKSGLINEIKTEVDDQMDDIINTHRKSKVRRLLEKMPIPERLKTTITRSKGDFDKAGGFKSTNNSYGYSSSADEAFFISSYHHSKTDNISMFFGRLISNKLREIPLDELMRALPGRAEDAFEVAPENAFRIISLAKAHLIENGVELSDENIYKTCFRMSSFSRYDLHNNDIDSDLYMEKTLKLLGMPVSYATEGDRQTLDSAMAIIEAAYHNKRRSISLSACSNTPIHQKLITSSRDVMRACERSFLNDLSSVTFKELNLIKQNTSNNNIKDIYISATGSKLHLLRRPRTLYFSHKENSNTPIQKAIRASMTIPLLFNKTKHGKHNLYDGGLFENTPITPFKSEQSTIVAMAEDQEFFERASTPTRSWKAFKAKIFPNALTWMNSYINKLSLSDSMRTIISSSYQNGTVDFSFNEMTLAKVSSANHDTLFNKPGFKGDAMYYFLRNKHVLHNETPIDLDHHLSKGVSPGVFSNNKRDNDHYGKDVLKLAKEHNAIYDI